MKVKDIVEALNLKVISGKSGLENDVYGGYSSDLLSDVMGNCNANTIWVTLQTHKNVMAIASLKDIAAVVLVKDNMPEADTIKQSETEGIPILSTSDECFEISGKIYQLLQSKK